MIKLQYATLTHFVLSYRRRIGIILCILILLGVCSFSLAQNGLKRYYSLLSVTVYDRNHVPITITANDKGLYAIPVEELDSTFTELLLAKEDRHFYFHPGSNPLSIARATAAYLRGQPLGGMSTITEQLTKNILRNENERTITNKLIELGYALSFEIFLSKEEILTMYANTVYLGNQLQGFETASHAYFQKRLHETTPYEQVALLATLSHPTTRNPWEEENVQYAKNLWGLFRLEGEYLTPKVEPSYSLQDESAFELSSLGVTCTTTCTTTLDTSLTNALREMLNRTVEDERDRGVRTGGIVVIDTRRNELLAIVGSPNPANAQDGNQINMALAPRPIGSTVKPFIYAKGFEEELRPYTLVDDREYRYPIGTGFALYPKNFDGSYHGEITLHYALSNSLNVPSVKVLEFIGLNKFYHFIEDTLTFKSIRPLDSYQYGIALGGLEMDLLTLTHFFTLFPNNGVLMPLTVVPGIPHKTPQGNVSRDIHAVKPEIARLVTTILHDRFTGVEQFGLESSLNLTDAEYAVKTGTSRDFHDSWVVGYTPDLVVGVWLGNSENTPLDQVSGQSGAGTIWQSAMEYLFSSPYHQNRTFSTEGVTSYPIENSLEWGLINDIVAEHQNILISDQLITSIYTNDIFEFTKDLKIPLKAKESVSWYVNNEFFGNGDALTFSPQRPSSYEIQASYGDMREIVTVRVTPPQEQ